MHSKSGRVHFHGHEGSPEGPRKTMDYENICWADGFFSLQEWMTEEVIYCENENRDYDEVI